MCNITNIYSVYHNVVWILGLVKVLGWKSNEWVANPIGRGQTSALKIKTANQYSAVWSNLAVRFGRLVVYFWLFSFFYSAVQFRPTGPDSPRTRRKGLQIKNIELLSGT